METDQGKLLKKIASFLNKHKIPYMLTGAWSVIYYGRPRASHDIDFVVEIAPKKTEKTINIFKTLPREFSVDGSEIKQAIKERGMFNIIHLPTLLKLDFWLSKDDKFDKMRFSRRRPVRLLNQLMYITTPEDIILKKLLWYQTSKLEKHFVDAAFVYQIQKKELDMEYLAEWLKRLNIEKVFQKLSHANLEDYL